MQKKMRGRVIVAAIGLSVAGAAGASGFQLFEQNASGLGNAYAGSAVVGENASTVFYNPAAMTKLPGNNFSTGLAVIKPSYKFKDTGSSNGSAAQGSNGGDAGDWAALPNLYATWQLSDNWFAGLGMGSPFGLKTEYESDWAGRFQSRLFDIKTYNVNPSLGFKASDSVSFGFGVNYQRMEVQYIRQAATANAATQATELTLDADSEAYGWNAGALFKLSPVTEMGFSYRSKIFHRLEGTLSSSNQAVSPNTGVTANFTLPDTYILSISQRLDDRWEMLGDVSRTNWSAIDKVAIVKANGALAQTLDARFRDTWRFALGGTYKVNDSWKWKYGVAYDQTPVRSNEERLLSLPDNNRYWFSTGAQWKIDQVSVLDLGVSYIYVPKTNVDADQSSLSRGHVVGYYDGSIFIFGLQYSRSF
jgi:long-chain fatty acid transport protein